MLGTVGLLIWAKRRDLIANLGNTLDTLQNEGGFRLSDALYREALRQVDEE